MRPLPASGPILEERARGEGTGWLGIVLAVAASAMLFFALLFAYGFLRIRAASWPPVGLPPMPRLLPTLNLAVVVGASAMLHAAARKPGRVDAALGLGVAFVGIQVVLWTSLWSAGFTPSATGAYGSVLYALTAIHAVHVLGGLFGLGRARRRAGGGRGLGPLELRGWTLYWDFLAVVWAALVGVVFWL